MSNKRISKMLFIQNKFSVLFILISTSIITYFHYARIGMPQELHNMFTELYYLPLLVGALAFGLRGAFVTYLIISALYVPHVIMNWSHTFPYVANKLMHAVVSVSFALLAGYLVDREKNRQEQIEKNRYLASLGQAAAAIVHDLRNPLISIQGFAQRIYQGKGDIRQASETVLNSAQDMQAIVNDVLDFAKPIKLTQKEEKLDDIIRETCSYCRPYAGARKVNLTVEVPNVPLKITVDLCHLKRALVNLINNAIDASGQDGSVFITASSGQGYLHITIRDYGIGMDEETLKNIFIPFYSKKSSGTGLGMAIAKKIIEGHQGRLSIKSIPDQGTEVVVDLPL